MNIRFNYRVLERDAAIAGWSYTELSKRSGVSIAAISELFDGKTENARPSTIKRLADALGQSVERYIVDDNAPSDAPEALAR